MRKQIRRWEKNADIRRSQRNAKNIAMGRTSLAMMFAEDRIKARTNSAMIHAELTKAIQRWLSDQSGLASGGIAIEVHNMLRDTTLSEARMEEAVTAHFAAHPELIEAQIRTHFEPFVGRLVHQMVNAAILRELQRIGTLLALNGTTRPVLFGEIQP